MNQFVIHRSDKKDEGHYLLIGDIISGDISVGDTIAIPSHAGEVQEFVILDISFLDEISQKVDYIGLTIRAQDLSDIEGVAATVSAPL